jgi:predicted MFS family arabinose efflux permease
MIFNGASAQLAALMAVAGAGAIVASIIFSLLKSHRHFPAIVLIGAIGVGISLLLFAYVNNIAQGLTVTALLGFFATLVSLGSQSEMQIKVENELRGRVMSLWPLVIIGGPAILTALVALQRPADKKPDAPEY